MGRSILFVAATDRRDEIREHLRLAGVGVVETQGEGPRPELRFEVTPSRVLPAPEFLKSVLALLPVGTEIPVYVAGQIAGPSAAVAEHLSAAMGIDVRLSQVGDDGSVWADVAWVEGAVERLELVLPAGRWTWSAAGGLGRSTVTSREEDTRNPWKKQSWGKSLSERVTLVAFFAGMVGLAGFGKRIGDAVGHGDLGASVGTALVPLALVGLAWKVGIVRRPESGLAKIGLLAGAGVVLLLIARQQNGSSGAEWFGMAGLALLAGAAVWGWSSLVGSRPEEDWLPRD